jgi:imidazolonepropionase-like amidohydrolase
VDDLRLVVEESHRLGLPVAAHAHGTPAILAALQAGVDSIEHVTFWGADGNDLDEDLVTALSESTVAVSLTVGDDFTAGVFDPPPAVARRFTAIREAYAALIKRGATIVIGSDAGVAAHKPHDVLPHGIVQLGDLGAHPLAALAAATSTAARVCGVHDRKGHISPGSDADLLVLNGDPSEDLSRLLDVEAVYRSGTRVR